jgi:integrase
LKRSLGAKRGAKRRRLSIMATANARRRGHGEDAIYFDAALRHTFVSLLSDNGVAIEEISRLMGHSSSNVTETIYRHQIRPVITIGAEAMDKIFANEQ